jgi:hypothetical protein
VLPGQRARVDRFGNLIVTLGAAARGRAAPPRGRSR